MRFLLLSLFLSFSANAASLQGVGVFETLNKPWFMVGLYSSNSQPDIVDRLELRVMEEKISQHRFRKLWVEALAVSHHESVWQKHANEFELFFSILHGPLKLNDQLVLEREGEEAVLSINLREHARFSAEFIDVLATSMTGKIVLSPELRAGLLGEISSKERRDLLRDYDRLSPSLGRISETARWLRQRSAETQKLAGTPSA